MYFVFGSFERNIKSIKLHLADYYLISTNIESGWYFLSYYLST